MLISDYLFQKLKKIGVTHTFGIPGDFILPLYHAQERNKLKTVVMTHEPSAGFAADVYARLTGFGVAIATYGVGALNMVNPIAQAYAEESPVLVLSGAPEVKTRNPDALIHHRVKTFQSQFRIYEEVTAASAVIDDPTTAAANIDHVIQTVLELKRPGYIEIPRDMVNTRMDVSARGTYRRRRPRRSALDEALAEIIEKLNGARRPVAYVGVEVERYGLMDEVVALVEKLGLPTASSLMGKTAFPESHPNFIGNYMGHMGPVATRKYVENADCILSLGTLVTDINTGIFTSEVDQRKVIQIMSHEVIVSYHRYPDIGLREIVPALLQSRRLKRRPLRKPRWKEKAKEKRGTEITTSAVIEELNRIMRPDLMVVSDVGDCLFASVDLQTDLFLGPGYYSSMGFAIPGSVGAKLALPDRRAIVLVGDGGFQMTGLELITVKKLQQDPIIIVFDNRCYATLRYIDEERSYYHLPEVDYAEIGRALGGRAERVFTVPEFRAALQRALNSDSFYLVDVVFDAENCSRTLKRLAAGLGKKFKRA